MTIAEMHVNFRQYAQQMGMQNVRAILPEQIDILINQSITDTVNQLIRENIGITNDRVVTDNSKIGQINAFRTLYDIREIGINTDEPDDPDPDPNSPSNSDTGPIFIYDVSNRLQGLIKHTHQNVDGEQGDYTDTLFGKYMFLVDISINYTATTTDEGSVDRVTTAWYPVRIIDSAYLADTLNDFVLKNRFRSPIACIYQNDTIELYIDKFKAGSSSPVVEVKSGNKIIELTPNKLRIDLVKYPAIVKFVEDISEGASVDCDLPESMHGDIVKHAVDLYRIALNGSLHANQQVEQQQQQENVRNNYRNEGNQ